MSRLLVDDVTKTDARALLNVNKMATISDIVAPSNEYIYASGANELTVVEGCVIAVGGAGIFKTANTILTAANLDAGSAFAVGKDYYVYICDSRIDSADEKYVISLNSTYPTGWNATNSRKIGGFHYGRCRKVDSNLQPLNGSSVIFGTGWESAVSNGIVPRSVWTLGHRPKCSPEGMVYLGGGTWVDIYLNSDDGAKGLKSEYGCAPMTGTESMKWYNFVERLAKSGKRLPNYAEFCAYAFGSPAGLDNANTNAWSATSNTGRGVTGSVVNAVSSVGVVDAVEGVVQKQEHRSSKVDPQVQPGVIHNVRVGAQQLEQRAGEHRPQGHDDEAQHAQGDDSGGDGGLHLVDAPGPEQLGDHHVTAHRQPGGHRHRQKHDGEGGAYRCHRVLPHELAHYSGVHHVVELLEQISKQNRKGKKKNDLHWISDRHVFSHSKISFTSYSFVIVVKERD